MVNIILIILLVAIAAGIVFYIYKAKNRGEVCIGCPYAKECAKKHSDGCGCGHTENKK